MTVVGSRVPAIARATQILEWVARSSSAPGVTELAAQLGLPKSSVFNLCASLVDERLLLRGADGSFRLGPRAYELASAASHHDVATVLVGVTVQNASNPFFAAEIRAAEEEAAASGVRISATHADGDWRQQDAQIRRWADAGAKMLVVDPIDSHSLAAAADYAHARGVSLVAINAAATNFDAAVTTDNAHAGLLAGEHMVRMFPRGARIAVIGGTQVTAIADRIDGFRRAIDGRTGFEIVAEVVGDNTESAGERLATEVLDHHHVDAFFAINDLTAIGVARAISAGGQTIPVIGVDGSARAVAAIRAGESIVATVTQDPTALGRAGVRLGLELLSGRRPRNRTVQLPTRLITASNLDTYTPW